MHFASVLVIGGAIGTIFSHRQQQLDMPGVPFHCRFLHLPSTRLARVHIFFIVFNNKLLYL